MLHYKYLAFVSKRKMKLFSLVLCVGMLCITTASRRLPQLQRRQDGSSDACNMAVINDQCTSGYQQGYATFLLECDQRETAVSLARACESSPSGTLCGGVDTFPLSETVTTTCGSSPTTCPSDCKELLTTTRAELGCCVNYLNNTDLGNTAAFDNSLWSLCDVELVTEECAPGPVKLPETDIDPICALDRLYDEVVCRTQYLESLSDALVQNCGFDPSEGSDSCIVNEKGKYCRVERDGDSNSFLFTSASTNCADTSTCEPLCTASLNNITSCCFINKYNGTSVSEKYDWLSYRFWTLCGLDSPGFCELKFNDDPVNGGATIPKAPGIAVTLAVALMVLPKI